VLIFLILLVATRLPRPHLRFVDAALKRAAARLTYLQYQMANRRAGPPVIPRASRGKVYLVPLGSPSLDLRELAASYQQQLRLEVEVLPVLALDDTVRNEQRGQLIAEELIALMGRNHPKLVCDPNAVLIGVTDQDMYIFTLNWDYALNFHPNGRLGVISTARLDPQFAGQAPNPTLLAARTRKLLTKNIGMLHYGLGFSNDPFSIMAVTNRGGDELDGRRDYFVTRDLRYVVDRSAGDEPNTAAGPGPQIDNDSGDPSLLTLHPYSPSRHRPDWVLDTSYRRVGVEEADVDVFQVDLRYGMLVTSTTDFYVPGRMPIVFTRTYLSQEPGSRAFGMGATHSYDWVLSSFDNMKTVEMVKEDNSTEKFIRSDGGEGFNPAVSFRGANSGLLSWTARGVWNMSWPDGTQYTFLPCGHGHTTPCKLIEIRDAHGEKMTFERDAHGNLTSLTADGGWLHLQYNANDKIIEGKDSTGHTVSYAYDAGGRLSEVRTSTNRIARYSYDGKAHLVTIEDSQDGIVLQNKYEGDKLVEQKLKSAGTYRFRYPSSPGSGTAMTRADVVRPDGATFSFVMKGARYTTYLNVSAQQESLARNRMPSPRDRGN
jgi:YD repeat-containing protein